MQTTKHFKFETQLTFSVILLHTLIPGTIPAVNVLDAVISLADREVRAASRGRP